MDTSDFGDRMKSYEVKETKKRFKSDQPIVVRLDGRGFSKFTKKFKRPFDKDFRQLMTDVATFAMKECDGIIAYTQSDEITIVIDREEVYFNGKKQKILSTLAGGVSSYFAIRAHELWPEHTKKFTPHFDCRVFNVPSKTEAVNQVLWRVKDCARNSVSMVAHSNFSHKELHKKNVNDMISMLRLRKDVEWNEYDNFLKFGVFIHRDVREQEIDDVTWNNIPEHSKPENRVVKRNIISVCGLNNPTFSDIQKLMYGDEE